jgi:hypothetical protein
VLFLPLLSILGLSKPEIQRQKDPKSVGAVEIIDDFKK